MTIYNIPTNVLKAVHLFAAKKDVRIALKGVTVEVKDGTLRITASCGHSAATWNCVIDSSVENERFTIPSAAIDTAIKAYGKLPILDISRDSIQGIPFVPVDCIAPPFERVWPKEFDGKPCAINPELFERVGKANKLLGMKAFDAKLYFSTNALIFDNGVIRGIIMPLRESLGNPDNIPAF